MKILKYLYISTYRDFDISIYRYIDISTFRDLSIKKFMQKFIKINVNLKKLWI